MAVKPYPAYKPSGVDWIGEIPEHWEVKKLKHLSSIQLSSVDRHFFDHELPVRVCHYPLVYNNEKINSSLELNQGTCTPDELGKFCLKQGDVLMTKDSESPDDIGIPALVEENLENAVCGYHLALISPNLNQVEGGFLFRFIQSKPVRAVFEINANGITRFGLGKGAIENLSVFHPPLPEQHSITSYLDRQTALIDELLQKTTQKIALLREQRSALINQAVTKGLDHSAPMKNSGVEWIGEVPRHWEVLQLKRISKIKYGLGQPPKELENGVPMIRATNIFRGKIVWDNMVFVDPDDIPYDRDPILKNGDIIVVRSGAYTADSALVTKEFEGSVAGYDMVITPLKAVPGFLAFSLLSSYLLENQLFLQRSRAAQPHLNAEELGSSIVLFPPSVEQERIIDFLYHQTTQIDTLILKEQQMINLLKEYRQALISEVVTGKMDVRDS